MGTIHQIDVIAGARPNFMKVAALFAAAEQFPALHLRLIHTGQHYDVNMSDVFFEQLALPAVDRHLGVGSGSHAQQTAAIMQKYEQWVHEDRPDACIVVGDVNSTIACALVAAKLQIPVAHVEAGLRSFDRTMPEEINRLLTDSISSLLFATEPSAVANLSREGHPYDQIHLVGHVMIDTLLRLLPRARELDVAQSMGLPTGRYAYITLHRPSNVDVPDVLSRIAQEILELAHRCPVVFPVHPRTRGRLMEIPVWTQMLEERQLHLCEPVGYLESLSLMDDAAVVLTDSGGLQEESTVLGIPCLTLRTTTERPITIEAGTNTLIGHDWRLLHSKLDEILSSGTRRATSTIPYWDGRAGHRILGILQRFLVTMDA